MYVWIGDLLDENWKKGGCLGIAVALVFVLLLLYFGSPGGPSPETWHVARTISWEAPPGELGEGGGEYVGVLELDLAHPWRLRLIANAEPSCVEQFQPEPCALSFISVNTYNAFFETTPIAASFDQFSNLNEFLTPASGEAGSSFELTVYAMEVASWDIQLQEWY
ncbi:MAG: hypothetical protein LN413_01055 [Candidatus Thermoplasmatota archaeon]|nr:hypothetical protein [Candidatus Thermoplasmatota archaeon]